MKTKLLTLFLVMFAMTLPPNLWAQSTVDNPHISLQEVPFWLHEDGLWGLNAPKNTQVTADWVVGESTGVPYGDSMVNNWADLSGYDKLVVTVTEGAPRILLNRDVDEGSWNDNEEESHLIDNSQGGWSSKYFTQETTTNGDVYTVDLKQIKTDKGFVHLHAIKGASWANVTVTSMMVELNGNPEVVITSSGDGTVDWSIPTGVGVVNANSQSDAISVQYDGELTLTFTPNTGYHLAHVYVNNVDYVSQMSGNVLTLHVTQNTTVRAVFATDTNNVQLTADMFYDWDGFGPLAQKTGQTTQVYVVGEPTEVAYGDPNVISYADLSAYSRLEVTVTEGTPRFLFNREYEYGQWCSEETLSHEIEYPNEGWSSKYFSYEGNVWSVDLKQMVADKGYAHLHAIKAPWNTQITVTKMELVDDGDNVYPEAYAVPSEGNTTLTFYYDTNKSSHEDAMSVVPFSSSESRGWDSYASNITKVEFDKSFANCLTLTSTANWFSGCNNLATINGARYIKTAEVTDMQGMFFGCSSLTSLDLSSFNTAKVSSMLQMFFGCSALTTIYVGSGWTVASLSGGEVMFEGCASLVGGYGTAYDADYLENSYARIDHGTSNPGYLTGKEPLINEMMFAWDGVGAGAQKTSQAYSAYAVGKSADIAFGNANVDIDVYVDLSSYSRLEVTTTAGTPRFLLNRDVTDGLPSENEAESHLIDNTHEGCMTWASKYFSSKPIDGGTLWMVNLEQLVQDKGFAHLHAIKGANDANVTVTKMDIVVAQNVAIEPEAYAVWTENYETDSDMNVLSIQTLTFYYDTNKNNFNGVDNTTVYPISDGGVTHEWRPWCLNFNRVVFDESFALYKPTSTASWFDGMENLTAINGIENLNTKDVTDMNSMFLGCKTLTSIDLSHFKTANVTSMARMFYGCSALETLDMTSFNTSNVMYMGEMFYNCTALKTIYVGSEWTTATLAGSESMFAGCSSLVGGQGTTYDTDHTDASYAHIDGGASNPGYLTDINAPLDTVATPTFSLSGDDLVISTTTEGATINYTISDRQNYYLVGGNGEWGSDKSQKFTLTGYVGGLPAIYSYVLTGTGSDLWFAFGDTEALDAIDNGYWSQLYGTKGSNEDLTGSFDRRTNLGADGSFHVDGTSPYYKFTINMVDMTYEITPLDSHPGIVPAGDSLFTYTQPIPLDRDMVIKATATKAGMNDSETATLDYPFSTWLQLISMRSTSQTAVNTYANRTEVAELVEQLKALMVQADNMYANQRLTATADEILNLYNQMLDVYVSIENILRNRSTELAASDKYYIVGEVNHWMPESAIQNMFYRDTNGNFTYTTDWGTTQWALKVWDTRSIGDWTNAWGTTVDGCQDESGVLTSINTASNGAFAPPAWSSTTGVNYCTLTFNAKTHEYTWTHLDDQQPTEYQTVGIVGDFNGWSNDVEMTQVAPHNWYIRYTFPQRTSFKLRANNAWDVDWSYDETQASVYYSINGRNHVDGINFGAEADEYDIYLNDITGQINMVPTREFSVLTAENVEITMYKSADVATQCSLRGGLGYYSMNKVLYDNVGNMVVNAPNAPAVLPNTEGHVTIPAEANGYSVVAIPAYAFNGTKISGVTLPASIVDYQDNAFAGCASLDTITSLRQSPVAIPDSTFSMAHYEHAMLFVPEGSIDVYKTTDGWKNFGNIYEIGAVIPDPEPYAVLSDNGTFVDPETGDEITAKTLTFYYDKKKAARGGMYVGHFYNISDRGWDTNSNNITRVVFDTSFANDTTIASTIYWFNGLYNLTDIEGLQYLNTQNVERMDWMFRGCESLSSIDVTGFDTQNVTSMDSMFEFCSGLTSLDLSSFNTQKVSNMMSMFRACSGLTTIYVGSKWSTASVINSSNMFTGCTGLVGGHGTVYDASYEDAEYAHIDGGTSNPGYFTDKNALSPNGKRWDFTKWSDETIANLKADAAASKTTGWSDVEKQADAEADAEPTEASKDNCFWLAAEGTKANGVAIAELEGLVFNKSYCSSRKLAIAVNYPSTSLGDYAGGAYLWLGGKDYDCFTIPNVKNGQTITIELESHKSSEGRGITLIAGSTELDSFTTTTKGSYSWTIPEDCDVIVRNTNGCHIYTITVSGEGTPTDDLEIFEVEKNSTVVPNQPITATSSVIVTPGNDSKWKTDGLTDDGTGQLAELSLVFRPGIYYSNSMTEYVFERGDMRGTNNPKDGELEDGESTGSPYVAQQKNLPKSGAYIIYEPQQDGSLILPVRVNASKPLYVVDGNGKVKTDIQFKDADGQTLTMLTSPLCALSSEEFVTGFVSFNVKQGEKYYVFSNASKLRMCGYVFSKQSIEIDSATMADVKGILEAEAYAVLSEENTKLTFYYDEKKTERNGIAIGSYGPANYEPWYENRTTLTTAVFDESFANDTTLTSTAYWFHECIKLTEIKGLEYLKTDKVTDMRNMFYGCSKLTTLDVNHLKTGNVTNMNLMFYYCSGLTSLDVTGFNTENVTDMGSMFNNCSGLKSLDISSFKTEKVKNMIQMFYQCYNLTTIYVGNGWSTASVTADYGYHMFTDCTALVGGMGTTYDENHVDVTYAHIDEGPSNPGYFTDKNAPIVLAQDADGYYLIGTAAEWNAFANMALTIPAANARMTADIDLGDDQTMIGMVASNEHYYQGIFDGQGHTLNVNLVNEKDVAPFRYIKGATIENLHVTGRIEANGTCVVGGVVAVTEADAVSTIRRCWSSALLVSTTSGSKQNTIGGILSVAFGPSIVEDCLFDGQFGPDNIIYNAGIFANNYAQGSIIRNTLNIGSYSNNSDYWSGTFYRTDESTYDVQLENVYYKNACGVVQGTQVTDEQLVDGSVVQMLQNGRSHLVWKQGSLNPILDFTEPYPTDIVALEPYAVLSENNTVLTFYYDKQKEQRGGMDIGEWDEAAKSTTMVVVDASFASYHPTSTVAWFAGLTKLASIEGMSNLKTDSVTNMWNMFGDCISLMSIDLSGLKTDKVENMGDMFGRCSGLTSLDVSNLNTENVNNMQGMFAGCKSLMTLDLSGFKTDNVSSMYSMFSECSSLKTIYVGDGWSTANNPSSEYMFAGCTSLVGGMGTVFDENHVDATYAHIDGGPSNPGYFTLPLSMGDANGDGNINIADAVATVTNILGQPTAEVFYQYAADMNNDKVIDIFDVTMIVNAALEATSPAPVITRGSADNIMMEHISMTADANYIYLGIDQPERFTATQFDVTLPEGMELVEARLASATTDHQLSFVKRSENEYRVIGLSMSNATFRSLNGQLIKLEVSGSAVDSDVKMSNVLFVTPSNKTVTAISECLNTAKAADDSLYDLKGQRLSKQQLGKGIYIMNHKKVMIK